MKSRWAAISLALVSTLLGLLVLEAAVRLLDGVPLLSTENFVARALSTMRPTGSAAIYDPQLGWTQAPNFTTPGPPSFTTGEIGARMSSRKIVPLQQDAVLVTGDSFAVGSEVTDAESWPAQLEAIIGEQVVNAAVGSYGFDQSVLRAEALIPPLRPRVVVIEVVGALSNYYNGVSILGGTPKPYFRIENGSLKLHNVPVPRLASRVEDIGWLRSVLGHFHLVHFTMTRLNVLQWWVAAALRNKQEYDPTEGLRVSCELMKRLAILRDRAKLRVVVVMQYGGTEPTMPTISWDRPAFLACIKQQRLESVDILDALRSKYQRDGEDAYKTLWVMHENNRAYGHMSASGNRLVASLIAAEIFGKNVLGMTTP